MSENPLPQIESVDKTQVIRERVDSVANTTRQTAEDLLADSGERAAAQLIAMHNQLNHLVRNIDLRGEDRAKVINELFQAITALSQGIVGSREPLDAHKRQEVLADPMNTGKLRRGVQETIIAATGSIGPDSGQIAISDTELK